MVLPTAAIFGCEKETLTDWEKDFFRDLNPHGFILFKRNCSTGAQIKRLTAELRDCVGRENAPILIDQEGGRVARLGAPEFPIFPPMKQFGDLALTNMPRAKAELADNTRQICQMLLALGVDVDCIPVLDVLDSCGHNIIGDRSFGTDPQLVAELGQVVVETCFEEGLLPIIKHIPGHGRATVDSHEDLPIVTASLCDLQKRDFIPFQHFQNRKYNNILWAMLAHVIYNVVDAENPASISSEVIAMIRQDLGFNGILIADDLSMKALSGSFKSRAEQTLAAGADLALHCNGDKAEMLELAPGLRPVTEQAWQKLNWRAQLDNFV